MRVHPVPRADMAFSRVDLVVVLLVLAAWMAIILPALGSPFSTMGRVQCQNNLRQIGVGFYLWAAEHQDRMPWRVPASQGGLDIGSVEKYFLLAGAQFRSPNILVCPDDGIKSRARSFTFFTSDNLSYFAGFHANQNRPRLWLSGDRNLLGLDSQYCPQANTSATRVGSGGNAGWKGNIHQNRGNILFGDGSAALFTSRQMSNEVARAIAEDAEGGVDIGRTQL